MTKFSFKKLVSAMALSLSLALAVPSMLPAVSTIKTVEAASLKLNKKSATLLAGQTIKLTIKNKGKKSVTWSTNKKKVATVKNGRVTAVGKGTAVITAKVGNKKLKCKIKVSNNSYSFSLKTLEQYLDDESVYFVPTKVYYKNGKLYCKTALLNKKFTYTIKKLTDKNGKDISKINITVTACTFAKTLTDTGTETVIAKGKVKNTLPSNIKYNKAKYFTVVFSGSQIKKKGFDLSKIDYVDFQINTDLYAIRK